jgi:hypothetical protein
MYSQILTQTTFSFNIKRCLIKMTSITQLLDLPLYHGKYRPQFQEEIIKDNPLFGAEYGFDHFGNRLSNDILQEIDTTNWNIEDLAKLVNLITWANTTDDQWVEYQRPPRNIDTLSLRHIKLAMDITDFGNIAYMALNANNADVRRDMRELLESFGVIKKL